MLSVSGAKVQSDSEVAKSCPTPSNPMDCSLPGFSIHGVFQARVLEWGAIAFWSRKIKYVTISTVCPSICHFTVSGIKNKAKYC